MLPEQPPQLPLTNSEPLREHIDCLTIESTLGD
jgi:hypothetical protein